MFLYLFTNVTLHISILHLPTTYIIWRDGDRNLVQSPSIFLLLCMVVCDSNSDRFRISDFFPSLPTRLEGNYHNEVSGGVNKDHYQFYIRFKFCHKYPPPSL